MATPADSPILRVAGEKLSTYHESRPRPLTFSFTNALFGRVRLTQLGRGSEHRAGDPSAAISARVGHVIVGRGVDGERRSVGVGKARQVGTGQRHRRGECAVGPNIDIGQITRMRPQRIT